MLRKKIKAIGTIDLSFFMFMFLITLLAVGLFTIMNYWGLWPKRVAAAVIMYIPISLLVWLSASKDIKAFELILPDYLVWSTMMLMSLTVLKLRNEELYFGLTSLIMVVMLSVTKCIREAITLSKCNLNVHLEMYSFSNDLCILLYFGTILAGMGYYRSVDLFTAQVVLCVAVRVNNSFVIRSTGWRAESAR